MAQPRVHIFLPRNVRRFHTIYKKTPSAGPRMCCHHNQDGIGSASGSDANVGVSSSDQDINIDEMIKLSNMSSASGNNSGSNIVRKEENVRTDISLSVTTSGVYSVNNATSCASTCNNTSISGANTINNVDKRSNVVNIEDVLMKKSAPERMGVDVNSGNYIHEDQTEIQLNISSRKLVFVTDKNEWFYKLNSFRRARLVSLIITYTIFFT